MTKKILKKITTTAKKKVTIKKLVEKPKSSVRKLTVSRRGTSSKTPLVLSGEEKAFYAVNGSVIRSLLDLYTELSTMREEEFAYHADSENNHFSLWVSDVILDEDCAEELKMANTRRKARSVLKRHLEKYSY